MAAELSPKRWDRHLSDEEKEYEMWKHEISYLLSSSFVPGTSVSSLCALMHLILIYEVDTIIILILSLRKLKHQEAKWLARSQQVVEARGAL